MKWMVAMCTLVMAGGLVQAQVVSSDSPAGEATSSEQQPPSDLLPGVSELPPAVAGGKTGMASTARAGRLSRSRRQAASSRHALHRRLVKYRYGRRHGNYAHNYRRHRHSGGYRHSLVHRHRHRRHLVLSPYGPYMVPASFYGPPGPYGPPFDSF